MRVLSLFDGMRTGIVAMERCGIYPSDYFASEVDKYAISVAVDHEIDYPDTNFHNLGDVQRIDFSKLGDIDMVIGGSPCQGFSFAGHRKGMVTKENIDITSLDQYLGLKRDGFEFDGQSYLFWEFMRALKELRPKYFLLENTRMHKKWLTVINEVIGVEPILINSSLVSAQERKRWYWTNIPGVTQPEDKGLILNDVLEDGWKADKSKSYAIIASVGRTTHREYFKKNQGQMVCNSPIQVGMAENMRGHDIIKRIYSTEGKCPTITAVCGGGHEKKIAIDSKHWRKVTPLECERLQTIPDNYTEGVSNSQRYKMLGNGWTVDVIAHILSFIPEEER